MLNSSSILVLVLLVLISAPELNAGKKGKKQAQPTCASGLAKLGKLNGIPARERLRLFVNDPSNIERFSGGSEGDIFLSSKYPGRALKIYTGRDPIRYESSVTQLKAMSQVLENRAGQVFTPFLQVAKIHEFGSDWIVKDFYPNSLEMTKALKHPEFAKKAAAAKQKILERMRSKLPKEPFKRMYQLIKNDNTNVHFNPDTGKLAIIDSQ